jgi:hypothetical protein
MPTRVDPEGYTEGQGQGSRDAKEYSKKRRKKDRKEGRWSKSFLSSQPHIVLDTQNPHLRGCGLPRARRLLPSPLEVGAVSWALGFRPRTISGALAGLGLTIPTFCGRLLWWPRAERPRERSRDPEGIREPRANCFPP